jgi:hypothetical protein
MNYDIFYGFFHAKVNGSVLIRIIGMDYDREKQAVIVHFESNLSGIPDSFMMDEKTAALFRPYLINGEILSLKGRCFRIDYSFADYDSENKEQYFDCCKDKKAAVIINSFSEISSDSACF